ncbi:EAL domain-containing protein [Vibrio sp. BS-M-Sm-2]|uniref:EAL domain-containing protein n=1 Tax=Vibrio sp. BS-M-Sm-2 TaxID=3241167 RepID=UPI003557E80D
MFKLEVIYDVNLEPFGYEILSKNPPTNPWENWTLSELNKNTIQQLNYILNHDHDSNVFVNIERQQFFDSSFLSRIEPIIKNLLRKRIHLTFEVTERGGNENDWLLLSELKQRYKFKLAADDVMNINDFRKNEIEHGIYDFVKMEPFFLQSYSKDSDEVCERTGEWMKELLKRFNLEFIAERIETEKDLCDARDYPFSSFQGYYFNRTVYRFGQRRLSR